MYILAIFISDQFDNNNKTDSRVKSNLERTYTYIRVSAQSENKVAV